jgi:hypothetical protein
MERVTGIGGIFFRANDPQALSRWYAEHLGVDEVPTSYGGPAWATVSLLSPVSRERATGALGVLTTDLVDMREDLRAK